MIMRHENNVGNESARWGLFLSIAIIMFLFQPVIGLLILAIIFLL